MSFIVEVTRALEAGWEDFNRELFGSRLSGVPVITLQTRGQKRSHAWYWPDKWTDAKENARAELNVCAEDLRMGPEKTLLALVHEMVHQRAHEAGVPDTSQEGRYHNRRFKALAEEAGLWVPPGPPDKKIGYGGVEWGPNGSRGWAAFCGLNPKIKETLAQAGRRLPRPLKPGKLLLFECRCESPYKPRQGRADFLAICGRCGHWFFRRGAQPGEVRAEISRALEKILEAQRDLVEALPVGVGG